MTTRNPDGTFWLTAPDPGHPPTRAAWKAAEFLVDMFAQRGVHCREGNFTDILATNIDCYAGLPELLQASAAWDLCSFVLANGGAPRSEFAAIRKQLREALDACGVVTVPVETTRPQ